MCLSCRLKKSVVKMDFGQLCIIHILWKLCSQVVILVFLIFSQINVRIWERVVYKSYRGFHNVFHNVRIVTI